MGYECPVCATPQADRRHLADHLAVTAVTHGDEHEDWLDEHVPDWEHRSPRSLGEAVVEFAAETASDRAFDAVDAPPRHDDQGPPVADDVAGPAPRRDRPLTDEERAVLEDAVAMTEAMLGEADDNEGETDE